MTEPLKRREDILAAIFGLGNKTLNFKNLIDNQNNMYLCAIFSIDNWLTLISLVFAAIGGIFIYWQWKKSVKIKRAEFINQILEKLRFDKDLTETMSVVDYKQDWYHSSFHKSELGRVDTNKKLLSLCHENHNRAIG